MKSIFMDRSFAQNAQRNFACAVGRPESELAGGDLLELNV